MGKNGFFFFKLGLIDIAGGGDEAKARGEKQAYREEDAGGDTGTAGAQSLQHRTHGAQGPHGHQGQKNQCSSA